MFLFNELSFRVILKQIFLPLIAAAGFLMILCEAPQAQAKAKTKLNTQIFESESTEQTFSEKVKIVRDVNETEVFFESKKNPGPYTLPENLPSYGLYKARLEKSKKPNGPAVKVIVDNDRIKSVEMVETKERSPSNEKDVIDSLFKK